MRRRAPVLGVVAGLVLVSGCTDGPERLDGAAGPIGAGQPSSAAAPAPSPSPPASVTATTPSSRPTSKSPAAGDPSPSTSSRRAGQGGRLGPSGVGALRLGMTRAQAEGTGLVTEVGDSGGNQTCHTDLELRNAPIFVSRRLGVAAITAYPGLATPEGIELGSSAAAVKDAYPDWSSATDEGLTGRGTAKVPGNGRAYYNITITGGKVDHLQLQLREQDCYE